MSDDATAQIIDTVNQRVITLEHAIFGNGRKGIKERVITIEAEITTTVKLLKFLIALSVPSFISIIAIVVTLIQKGS